MGRLGHITIPLGRTIDPLLIFGFHFNSEAYQSRNLVEVTGKTYTTGGGALINDPSAPMDTIYSNIAGEVDNVSGNFVVPISANPYDPELDFVGNWKFEWDYVASKESNAQYVLFYGRTTGIYRVRTLVSSSNKNYYFYEDTPLNTQTSFTATSSTAALSGGTTTIFPLSPTVPCVFSFDKASLTTTLSLNGSTVTGSVLSTAWPVSGGRNGTSPYIYFGHQNGAVMTGMKIANGKVSGQRSYGGISELVGFGKWLLISGQNLPGYFTGADISTSDALTIGFRINVIDDLKSSRSLERDVICQNTWRIGYKVNSSNLISFMVYDGTNYINTTFSYSLLTNYAILVTKSNTDNKLRLFVNGTLAVTGTINSQLSGSSSQPFYIGGRPTDIYTDSSYINWPFCLIADLYMRKKCEQTTSYVVPTTPFSDSPT